MGESTIVICQNNDDISNEKSAIVLSEVISQFSENEANNLVHKLINLDVKHNYDVPIYQIISNQVWDGRRLDQSSPRSMEVLIQLYRYLSEEVPDETEQIICVGVSGIYLKFIRDFADNENINLMGADETVEPTPIRSIVFRSMVWILISLFDGVISLLLRPFFSPTDADVLIKYPMFRSDTFQPIETNMDIKFDSTFTLLTLSYFSRVRSVINEGTTVIPIRCFNTISGMYKNYRFVIVLIHDLLTKQRTETAVIDAVESEMSIRLERTVGHQVRRHIWRNMKTFIYYRAACQLFNRKHYNSILLTSTGPSGMALALPAAEREVDIYCLPHAIRMQKMIVNRNLYHGVFTEGKIAECAVERKKTNFITTGYPKHLDIYKQRGSTELAAATEILLIGTQPYADHHRRAFIRDIVPNVLDQTDWNIVIKIHPGEKLSFYRRMLSEIGIDINQTDQVQITDSGLFEWIARSQLLLTINSNVGIESVILGTPAASYNPWSPDLRDPLYAKFGPIPSLRTSSDVVSLLQNWNGGDQLTKQESALDNLYKVRGNSLNKITNKIQDELTKSTNRTTTSTIDNEQ